MNYNELYILNLALDGKDICGIDKFSQNPKTSIEIDYIKKQMIKKGYLEDLNTFADIGVTEVEKLKLYKNGKKYVTIFHLVLSLSEDGYGIMLEKKGEDDFEFTFSNQKEIIPVLCSIYPHILGEQIEKNITIEEEGKYEPFINKLDNISARDLLFQFKINGTSSFSITTETLNKMVSKELYFASDDRVYCYDCLDTILYEKNKADILKQVKERLEA